METIFSACYDRFSCVHRRLFSQTPICLAFIVFNARMRYFCAISLSSSTQIPLYILIYSYVIQNWVVNNKCIEGLFTIYELVLRGIIGFTAPLLFHWENDSIRKYFAPQIELNIMLGNANTRHARNALQRHYLLLTLFTFDVIQLRQT